MMECMRALSDQIEQSDVMHRLSPSVNGNGIERSLAITPHVCIRFVRVCACKSRAIVFIHQYDFYEIIKHLFACDRMTGLRHTREFNVYETNFSVINGNYRPVRLFETLGH